MEAKAREVFDAIAQDAPLRAADGGLPAADNVIVALLAQALCRLESVDAWIGAHGWRDPKRPEKTTNVVDVESRLRREIAHLLDELGMSPRSRARLGLDLVRTTDLASAMSEPDPSRRAQMLADAGVPDNHGRDDDLSPHAVEGYSDPPSPVEGPQIERTGPEMALEEDPDE